MTKRIEAIQPMDGQSAGNNAYLDVITQIFDKKDTPLPETMEEAAQRFLAAQEAYEALEPPAVDMPDTSPVSFQEILRDRCHQFDLDFGEITQVVDGKTVLERVPLLDTSLVNNAKRLELNLSQEVPDSVFQWALAKTVLAAQVKRELFQSCIAAQQGKIDHEIVVDQAYNSDLVNLMQGRARIEIRSGKPTLVPSGYEDNTRALGDEIHDRRIGWEGRHKLMSRVPQLRALVPLLVDTLEAGPLSSFKGMAKLHFMAEYYGSRSGGSKLGAVALASTDAQSKNHG